MNDKPLRVGIIGCGNVTLRQHAPALQQMSGVRVVAVADPVASRREQVRALLGLAPEAAFDDALALLDAAPPDYAVVTAPPALRRSIIEACSCHGVHVLAEKPIATIPAQAASLRALMAGANRLFGMVHNYRYFPEYRLLRQLIDEGAIGTIRHFGLNFLGVPDKPGNPDYRPAWRHDPAESGGGVLMDMIHVLYLAEYLAGEPARAVSAVVDNQGYPGGIVEDLALLTLTFDSCYATIQMAWGEGPGGVAVTGSKGRLLVFYEDYGTGPFAEVQSFLLFNDGGRQTFQPRAEDPRSPTFQAVHENFIQAIRGLAELDAPAEHGQRALEAALATYASAAQGCAVALPLAEADPVYLHGLGGLSGLSISETSPVWRRALFGIRSSGADRLP